MLEKVQQHDLIEKHNANITALKKEVTYDILTCSCCISPTATITKATFHDVATCTWLTPLSHNLVSMVFYKLRSRFLCRDVTPLSIRTKKSKLPIITLGNYFGLYLRRLFSPLCLVFSWRVTFNWLANSTFTSVVCVTVTWSISNTN